MTTLKDLLKGGENGPAIKKGDAKESLLIQAIKHESFEMPPEEKLSNDLIQPIEKWVDAGAFWPREAVLSNSRKITAADKDWWAFQPLKKTTVPQIEDANGWIQNDIDRFILARLSKAKINPAKSADDQALVRRIHYTLTGLPPNQDLLNKDLLNKDLLNGSGSDRAAKLIDQLLASKGYGENQARFWLDLVRYADSDGYRADHVRPEAKLYRQYVIDSFNDDKPYDRFVMEQLAGDEIDPGNKESLIATMFLRHWIYEHNQRDVETQWQQILNDLTETTADAFLAQGLKCARCHDHKFDPILQKDYYRMQSFFAAFQPREAMPIADAKTRQEFSAKQKEWEKATAEIRNELYAIENELLLEHSTGEGFDKFIPKIKSMIRKRQKDREPYEQQIAALAERQFVTHPEKLPKWLDAKTEKRRQELLSELNKFDAIKPKPLPTMKFVSSDVGTVAPKTFIPDDKTQAEILPGFLTILDPRDATIEQPRTAFQSTGRRTALAKWITAPHNPLTARVIVNRIWQQHFGRGLVETSSDFGHLGKPPSHPQLLDWLAVTFIENGWSFKKLHRLILNSATYQQSSHRTAGETEWASDPGNRLHWRFESRRLSAEEIVDTILTNSGEIKSEKRAIFRLVKRNTPDSQLSLFDFPDRTRSTGKRHNTTTSPQALMMMNNDWMHRRAKAMEKSLPEEDSEFVVAAFRRAYFREPTPAEFQSGSQFLHQFAEATPRKKPVKVIDQMPSGGLALFFDWRRELSASATEINIVNKKRFTIEATVLLKSLYPDATVRTIAAQWNGNTKTHGWGLGVTSTKSAFKPRNLIFQFVGKGADGKLKYEVAASNLRLELNKPYQIVATVDLSDTSKSGVQFRLKDLSKADSEWQTANVAHKVVQIESKHPFHIARRYEGHLWSGFIEKLRVKSESNLVFDLKVTDDQKLAKNVATSKSQAIIKRNEVVVSPEKQARIAFAHALLNSNELIYID